MPGPLPSFQPSFPDDFLCRVRPLLRKRSLPLHLYQRARLVLILEENPTTTDTAAAELVGLHPDSVRAWRKRWAAGDFRLEDSPGRGRKPAFSPARPGGRQSPGV